MSDFPLYYIGTCACGHDYRLSHHPSLEHNADQRAIHRGCSECECSHFRKPGEEPEKVLAPENDPEPERARPSEWKVGHVVSDSYDVFHRGTIVEIRQMPSVDGTLSLYDVLYQDAEGYDRVCTVTDVRLIAHRKGLPVRPGEVVAVSPSDDGANDRGIIR